VINLAKNSKYTFRVDEEVKDKFKMYCKIMKISPSDMLSEIMVNFNSDVDKIIQMKEVEELQAMMQGKFVQAEKDMELIKAKKEVANLAAEQRTC